MEKQLNKTFLLLYGSEKERTLVSLRIAEVVLAVGHVVLAFL